MFLRTLVIFALCAAILPAQVARPNLNGLELRKGQMIQQAQTEAQANLADANKEMTQADAAYQKNLTVANSTPTTQKEAAAKSRAISQILDTTQKDDQAKHRQAQAQLRVTQLQNQMVDWEQKTLAVHAADATKFKVDWTHGQIVTK